MYRGSSDHVRDCSRGPRVASRYYRWRSREHFRLDCRVIGRGSSEHVRDGARDPRVALLYSIWRSSDH